MGQTDFWNPLAPRHTTAEIWGLVQYAVFRGVDVEAALALRATSVEVLSSRTTLISLAHQIAVQSALALPADGSWTIDAACRLHPTTYGLAGFGLLCSDTLGAALRFCKTYAPLLNLKHLWEVGVDGAMAHLTLTRGYALTSPVAKGYEIYELIKAIGLMRDVTGGAFEPRRVYIGDSYAAATVDSIARIARCPVVTQSLRPSIEFDARLWTMPLPQREPMTHASCVEACECQLTRLNSCDRISARVRTRLESSLAAMPGIDNVARSLCLSARSLRRRLNGEGTSFQTLAEDVRRVAAERLLATTEMSTQAIANALGYGDVANFRHAFKRWKGETPCVFRVRSKASTAVLDFPASPVDHAARVRLLPGVRRTPRRVALAAP